MAPRGHPGIDNGSASTGRGKRGSKGETLGVNKPGFPNKQHGQAPQPPQRPLTERAKRALRRLDELARSNHEAARRALWQYAAARIIPSAEVRTFLRSQPDLVRAARAADRKVAAPALADVSWDSFRRRCKQRSDEQARCEVCGGGLSMEDDAILICDGCDCSVH